MKTNYDDQKPERISLTIMGVAIVILLSFSYAFRIDLLSRIFPGLADSQLSFAGGDQSE